jgi:hypothetical protein
MQGRYIPVIEHPYYPKLLVEAILEVKNQGLLERRFKTRSLRTQELLGRVRVRAGAANAGRSESEQGSDITT